MQVSRGMRTVRSKGATREAVVMDLIRICQLKTFSCARIVRTRTAVRRYKSSGFCPCAATTNVFVSQKHSDVESGYNNTFVVAFVYLFSDERISWHESTSRLKRDAKNEYVVCFGCQRIIKDFCGTRTLRSQAAVSKERYCPSNFESKYCVAQELSQVELYC